MGCDSDEKTPLLDNGYGNFMKQVLLAGGPYSACSVPQVLFVIALHKMGTEKEGAFGRHAASWGITFFWIGWALSSLSVVPWVDRLGRKAPLIGLVAAGLVATFVSAAAPSPELYAPAVFFIGFFLMPSGTVGYVLMQEGLAPQRHTAAIVILNVIFSYYGVAIAAIGGLWLKHMSWRADVLIWHFPFYLILLLAPRYLSESPAFTREDNNPTGASAQLYRDPELRKRLLLTLPSWVACVVGYYGLNFLSGNLSPSFYLNLMLLYIVDVVSYGAASPILEKFSVQPVQTASLSAAAAIMVMCSLVPAGPIRVAIALVGRFALNVAFTALFLMILPCFPPVTRGTALGICNCVGRCAGCITPFFASMSTFKSTAVITCLCLVGAYATQRLEVVDKNEVCEGGSKVPEREKYSS